MTIQNNKRQSTEDTCSLPLDTPLDEHKDIDQYYNLDLYDNEEYDNTNNRIIVPNSDVEEEQEIMKNKPFKRPNHRNRKRKRAELIYQDGQNQVLSTNINLDNISPIKSHAKTKRKLNNGSIQIQKHRDSDNKIQRTTLKNAIRSRAKSPTPVPSLISDLFNTKSYKKNKSKHKSRQEIEDKENISFYSNDTRKKKNVNPLSVNRKNRTMSRKSLAMIGAQNKPIDIIDSDTDSDNDNDQDSEIQFVAIKKQKQKQKQTRKPIRYRAHSFLSYSSPSNEDDVNHNRHHRKDKINDICEIISDDEDKNGNNDKNEKDDEIQTYSQLSQSQSEKQIRDVLSQFQFQHKNNTEAKEAETQDEDEDDEDDDIQIISKPPRPKPITKKNKKNVKAQKFIPKPFKPPRFKDGTSPKYEKSVKKKKNQNKTGLNVKKNSKTKKFKPPRKKNEMTSKNQTKLTAFFSKK